MLKRVIRWFLIHLAMAAGCLMLIFIGCPLFKLTGLTCPCCGLTRAWINLFGGNISTAFQFNPFFLLIPAYIFLLAHMNGPLKRHQKWITWVVAIFSLILFVFNALRWFGLFPMP